MKIYKIRSDAVKRDFLQFIASYSWLFTPILLTSLQLYLFTGLIDSGSALSAVSKISAALAESLILFTIFLFVPPKISKYTIWIPGILVTLFCVTNLLYFKAFSDLPSWETIKLITTVDNLVLKSSVALVSTEEPSLILIYFFEIILCYIFKNHAIKVFSIQFKTGYLTTTLIASSLFFFLTVRRAGLYSHSKSISESFNAYIDAWRLQTTNIGYYKIFGIHGYVIRTVISALHQPIPLSDDECVKISHLLLERANSHPNIPYFYTRNHNKNLIFIIVESLSSCVLTRDCSSTYLPVLTALLNDTTTITALKVIPQTGPGRSSDGQFIYNTGLLPLRTTALIESHASANYPSIAKALNYKNSIEIIGESKNVWRHFLTSTSYGFKSLFDNIAPDNKNADEKIFDKTLSLLDTLQPPFFALLSTLSMHDPYDLPVTNIQTKIPNQILDSRDRNYWTATAAFDIWLGNFIKALKTKNLYDSSIIIIAADHEPKAQFLSPDFDTKYIPIFILNSGNGMHITNEVKQVDLFPTILDIMGIDRYYCPILDTPYRGLGQSLLYYNTNDSIRRINQDDLWNASERLITSGKLAK